MHGEMAVIEASNTHFVFLDGMRGIAALAVVALHAGAIFKFPSPANASLAVDFFFCLSGFVLACAYDRRIGVTLSGRAFMWRRIVRLYPMLMFSMSLGAVLALWKVGVLEHGPPHVGLLTIAGFLMVPVFVSVLAYPLNFPAWSLFFELVASVGYSIERRQLKLSALIAATSAAGLMLAGLIVFAGHVSTFGVGGRSFILGFVRVAYPFGVGLLIHRTGVGLRLPSVPAIILALGLTFLLLIPISSWIYDLLAVIVVAPVLVALGSRTITSTLRPVWSLLGRISYPVYLLHAPILEAFHLMVPLPPPANAVAAFLATIGISYFVLIGFDEPMRKWAGSWRWGSPQPA